MSEMAKQARAAMKAKASKMTTADPHQKVDSSTWTPPEALNTEVKTGMRPVSRRAFKKGGKVMGEKAKCNLGRKPRKSGGKALTANSLINRNAKEANAERPGGNAHIGGLKTGGAAKRKGREEGGVAVKKIAPGVSGLSPGDAKTWAERTKITKFSPGDYKDDRSGWLKKENETTSPLTGELSFKKGGKAKRKGRASGGYLASADFGDQNAVPNPRRTAEDEEISPAMAARMRGIMNQGAAESRRYQEDEEAKRLLGIRGYKRGGKAKKAMGGPMAGSQQMMQDAQNVAGVPASVLDSAPASSRFSKQMGLKKGGAAKHDDVKQDMALIKKMVKPSARKGKEGGGGLGMLGGLIPMAIGAMNKDDDKTAKKSGGKATRKGRADGGGNEADQALPGLEAKLPEKYIVTDRDGVQYGGTYASRKAASRAADKRDMEYGAIKYRVTPMKADGGRTARKEGGGVFSGPGYPGKVPGVTGGRIARATGGKTKGKGKTNINIVIAAGQKQPGADMMGPPPGMGQPPGGLPIPVPPGAGAGGPPMPMPMPVAAPAPMPAPMPTPRKSGGRLTKVAHSYKDMEAGAGSGEGRLQKTDIAKFKAGRKEGGKVGHRTYRSYKDMDAGAGSGFGRLEKTEIQKRKH
jgi:hypothetical protein